MKSINDDKLMDLAKKIAIKKRVFLKTLISYILVNSFLIILYFILKSDSFWPIWPIIGWGIGLLFQGISAYANPYQDNNLDIEKEYQKLKNKNH